MQTIAALTSSASTSDEAWKVSTADSKSPIAAKMASFIGVMPGPLRKLRKGLPTGCVRHGTKGVNTSGPIARTSGKGFAVLPGSDNVVSLQNATPVKRACNIGARGGVGSSEDMRFASLSGNLFRSTSSSDFSSPPVLHIQSMVADVTPGFPIRHTNSGSRQNRPSGPKLRLGDKSIGIRFINL
jgi:hypothetical protein